MGRKLSDQQIDRIAERLLKDFAPDDGELDEIAESPKIWWKVRKSIEAEKARREKSWFAAFRSPALAFGVPAAVVCFGLAVWFWNLGSDSSPASARQNPVQNLNVEIAEQPANSPPVDSENLEVSKRLNPVSEKVPAENAAPNAKPIAQKQRRETSAKQINKQSQPEISPRASTGETKTDFIALSYAGVTDSGQIVRVKVPGAMLVSLGVKANVEDESELVQAEVVIGDDGLARAIRFIR